MKRLTSLCFAFCAGCRCWRRLPHTCRSPAQCEALRHKGDPTASACYQGLTRSATPPSEPKASGAWATYRSANDAFRAATKLREKDPAPRVRWGRMYLDHWPGVRSAKDLFQEALKIKEDYAPALLGMALVAGEQFEGAGHQVSPRKR